MINAYFKDYPNGEWQDWSQYVLGCSESSKQVESERPGEAGVIAFDEVTIALRNENVIDGQINPVFAAFSSEAFTQSRRYLMRVSFRSASGERKNLEGVVDLESVSRPVQRDKSGSDYMSTIEVRVVDKLSSMATLRTDSEQREELDFMDFVVKGYSREEKQPVIVALFDFQSDNNIDGHTIYRKSGTAFTSLNLQPGFQLRVTGYTPLLTVNYVRNADQLVVNEKLDWESAAMTERDIYWVEVLNCAAYWQNKKLNGISLTNEYLIQIRAVSNYGNLLERSTDENGITTDKYAYGSDAGIVIPQPSGVKAIPKGAILAYNNDFISKGEFITDYEEGAAKYITYWKPSLETMIDRPLFLVVDSRVDENGFHVKLLPAENQFDCTITQKTMGYGTGSFPVGAFEYSTIPYFDMLYKGQDIGIYKNNDPVNGELIALDLLMILRSLLQKIWPDIMIRQYDEQGQLLPEDAKIVIPLDYFPNLIEANPMGKDPLEFLKFVSDSTNSYIYFDEDDYLVIRRKKGLSSNTGSKTLNHKHFIDGDFRPFWDKLADAVEIKVDSWIKDPDDETGETKLQGYAFLAKETGIEPRNPISKTIFAQEYILNEIRQEFPLYSDQQVLDEYASRFASEYMNFYGQRHESMILNFHLYDEALDLRMLDLISDHGKLYFITRLIFNLIDRTFSIELVSCQGYDYDLAAVTTTQRNTSSVSGGSSQVSRTITPSESVPDQWSGTAVGLNAALARQSLGLQDIINLGGGLVTTANFNFLQGLTSSVQDHITSKANPHETNKTHVGLGNVDNIKQEPFITAGNAGQYFRGDKTWASLNKAAVGLSNVDDLKQEPFIAVGLATQYMRGDKTWQDLNSSAVGLGNVDNLKQEPHLGTSTVDKVLRGDRTWGSLTDSARSAISATVPILYNSATGVISLDYNTTNLKLSTNKLNTIQDLATTSSPTFCDITITGTLHLQGGISNTGTIVTTGGAVFGDTVLISGNLGVGGTITVVDVSASNAITANSITTNGLTIMSGSVLGYINAQGAFNKTWIIGNDVEPTQNEITLQFGSLGNTKAYIKKLADSKLLQVQDTFQVLGLTTLSTVNVTDLNVSGNINFANFNITGISGDTFHIGTNLDVSLNDFYLYFGRNVDGHYLKWMRNTNRLVASMEFGTVSSAYIGNDLVVTHAISGESLTVSANATITGNLTVSGVITAGGANSTQWKAAYDHSQTAHVLASTVIMKAEQFGSAPTADVIGTWDNLQVVNDSHTHDARYNTKAEVTTLLSAYQPLINPGASADYFYNGLKQWSVPDVTKCLNYSTLMLKSDFATFFQNNLSVQSPLYYVGTQLSLHYTGNLTVDGSGNLNTVSTPVFGAVTASSLQLIGSILIRNKADNAYLEVAQRNTTGTEVVWDLYNIGKITIGEHQISRLGATTLYLNNGFYTGGDLFIGGQGRFYNSLYLVNKAGSSWLPFASRNIAGTEAVYDLTNVGNITASDYIQTSKNFYILSNGYGVKFSGMTNTARGGVFGSGDVIYIGSWDNGAGRFTINASSGLSSITDGTNSILFSPTSSIDFTRASVSYIKASNAAGYLAFQTGGSNTRMTIDAAGSIGIGTTTPGQQLHQQSAGDVWFRQSRSGGAYYWDLGFDSNSNYQFKSQSGGVIATLKYDGGLGIAMVPTEKLSVAGNINLSGNYSFYNNFASGWTGTGFRLDYGVNVTGKSTLEVDYLIVRKNLNVYELIINQYRATNGSQIFSAVSKVKAVNGTVITLENPDNSAVCPFTVGALIETQVKSQSGVQTRIVQATVSAVNGFDITVTYSTGTFSAGDIVVRKGHTTDANLKGYIVITSDDTNAPYIRVMDDISSIADQSDLTKLKTQIGRLDGLTSTAFGALSGYGGYLRKLYAENEVKIAGDLYALTGGFGGSVASPAVKVTANGLYVQAGTAAVTATDGTYIGNWTASASFSGAIMNAAGLYGYKAGVNAFSLDATTAKIAGFDFDNGKIFKANFVLNSAGYLAFGSTPPSAFGNSAGAFIGSESGFAKLSLYYDANNFLQWDGTKPLIKSPYFSLGSDGRLTATEGSFTGAVNATSLAISGSAAIGASMVIEGTGSGTITRKVVYGETIAAGDILKAVNVDGAARMMKIIGCTYALTGSGSITGVTPLIVLSPTKMIGSSGGSLVVMTYTASNNTMTIGAVNTPPISQKLLYCPYDETRFIAFRSWIDGSDVRYISAYLCTVSGETITFGDELRLYTGDTTANSDVSTWKTAQIPGKGCYLVYKPNSYQPAIYYMVISVVYDTLSLTTGRTQLVASGANGANLYDMQYMNPNATIFVYTNNSSGSPVIRIIGKSDVDISTYSYGLPRIKKIDDSRFLLEFQDQTNSTYWSFMIGQISQSSFIWSPKILTALTYAGSALFDVRLDGNYFVGYYYLNPNTYYVRISVGQYNPSIAEYSLVSSSAAATTALFRLAPYKTIHFYGSYFHVLDDDYSMFTAIAQEAGSAGETKKVSLIGTVSQVHSGLTQGVTYGFTKANPNKLVIDYDDGCRVGIALSATDIFITR